MAIHFYLRVIDVVRPQLRGDKLSFKEADRSTQELADKLGLLPKINSVTSQLSGGMKRRTQLAMALAGGADILVLDEPTSGLDVETRRELWDLLLVSTLQQHYQRIS